MKLNYTESKVKKPETQQFWMTNTEVNAIKTAVYRIIF